MIRLENIIKYFHKGSVNEVFALNNINLQIDEGDFVTVIGSNGAGKSTLLNCIAGGFFPDSGTILIAVTMSPAGRNTKGPGLLPGSSRIRCSAPVRPPPSSRTWPWPSGAACEGVWPAG